MRNVIAQVFTISICLAGQIAFAASGKAFYLPKDTDAKEAALRLRKENYRVDSWGTDHGRPVVFLASSEKKDPSAVLIPLEGSETKRIRELGQKLESGAATTADRDQLLSLLVKRVLSDK